MGLTKNGKRYGMAAHIEAIENMRYIEEEVEKERKRTIKELLDEERDLMGLCAEYEGSDAFAAWYESDQVPDNGPIIERIRMISQRIHKLTKGDV